MKKLHYILLFILLLFCFNGYSQNQRPEGKKVKISGKVIDKATQQPLEYATITLQNEKAAGNVTGGITNTKGEFGFEVPAGTYTIKIEFISFKPIEIKQKSILEDTNLGSFALEEDATMLNEVEIRAEKTTVEIKLDKKVYNVGSDIMVKGGTVSDVLDNIPSVAVDADGTVRLRGNENIRILIDGKPSNAINITEALRLIPADAIEKVEVITNPSARYDAEGGGGLLNIILKKGKNQGINGTLIASAGNPENYGISGNVNYKNEKFNLFTTQGYNYRNNPGNAIVNSRYLNPDNTTKRYLYESRENRRINKGYNGNLGMEFFLDKNTSWTHSINYRKNNGDNLDDVFQDYYKSDFVYDYTRNRINDENSKSENVEYATNFIKNFKKEGHKLTIDGSFSISNDSNTAVITDAANNTSIIKQDNTINNQKQGRDLIQIDYVLPLGKGSQFEAGYRADYSTRTTGYSVVQNGIVNPQFTNNLEYKEKVNALYSQYGFKVNKFSALFGLRWEDSNIDVNQLATNDFNKKKYNNFFPSAFFTYDISDKSSASISYSRRIQRPRGRMLNPFTDLSSNINIFVGNPDLNPAFTDAIDVGYIKRWEKLTFNTSFYINKTTNIFTLIRRENGQQVENIPVIISTPVNLAKEYIGGLIFTLNYSPYKWWKLNGNFDFYRFETKGDHRYTSSNGNIVSENFDNIATSWFSRLTSKITLPYKIDWQTNFTYNAPQNNVQGRSLGVYAANLGFSKDILKDKATIALNVNDVFNSRKRIMETFIPGRLDAYSEMQWRVRQITVSFTYRFNKKKTEKERVPKRENDEGGGDFPG